MKVPFLIFLIVFHLLTIHLMSQTSEIERLMNTINKKHGKEKLEACSELSFKLYSIDPSKGIYYGQLAIRMADSLKFPEAFGKAYNNLGANYLALAVDDSARTSFLKALKYANEFKDTTEMATGYNRLGVLYEKTGVYDSALYVFQKALIFYTLLKNHERMGLVNENIGMIHLHRGELKTALHHLLEAKSFFEKAGMKNKLSSVYLKIGRVYSETNDFESAEKYYQKGKQQAIELGDFHMAGIAINAIGIMFKDQEKYEEALKNYLEVIEIVEKISNKTLLLAVYGNIGNVYEKLGDSRKALDYHQKALEIAESLNSSMEAAKQHVGLGNVYNSVKNYDLALNHFEKALPIFEKSKASSDLLAAINGLIEANNGLKNYERSVVYYGKYLSLKDSLNRNELNTALDSLKVKFNTEQTLQENILLAQKTEIQKKTISLQRNMMFSSFLIAVLLVGFTLMIYRNRKKIKKTNVLLEEKNHEISAQADELKQKNQQLVELSQFKDSMQSFLVHDLKNPLNKLLSINSRDSFEKSVDGIRQTGMLMLNIVTNLLDIGKYEENKMKPGFQEVSLTQIINDAFVQIQYFAHQKSISLVIGYTTDFIVKADPEMITRVFVNLLANAIKFSPTGGNISVFTEIQNEHTLKLTVKDEGEGISAEYKPYIFDRFTQGKVRHLGLTGSTGIGLTFCRMAIESHGGEIGVHSDEHHGSSFWFTLPLKATLKNLPADLAVFDTETTKPVSIKLSTDEKSFLQPFCNTLKNTSIYQISDVKETVNRIDWKSENIIKWKSQVMQALSECNEIKYVELINLDNHE